MATKGTTFVEKLLVFGVVASATGCGAGATGLESSEESAGSAEQGLTLQGVGRCTAQRFESTVAAACSAQLQPVDAGPLEASRGPFIAKDAIHGVRLPASGSQYAGAVSFAVAEAGEYIVYLGTPNVELRVDDAAGVAVAPTCGSHLPTVAPQAYPADCTLRGAYALNLRRGEIYTLRFGPAASHYVRVAIKLRRAAGVTLRAPACDAAALNSTLASACAAAEPSTPITAAPPGSSQKQIAVGTSYGVRLRAAGAGFEGTVTFTPPYTADYLVYSGTPNLGVGVFGAGPPPTSNACGVKIDDAACPLWKAAFRYQRLEGGVPRQLEFGPTSASWVRALVLPVQADSDADGLADNYDQCPTESFPGTSCGCAAEICVGGALWSRVIDEGSVQSVAVDSMGQILTVGTTFVAGVDEIGVSKFDASGNLIWRRSLRTSDWAGGFGEEVASDTDGNVIVGGGFDSSSTFTHYAYVAKLDPAGNLLWDNSFSNGEDDAFSGRVAVDGSGNIFSSTSKSELLEDYTSEAVLRKLAPDGVLLWTRSHTGTGIATGGEVAVDPSGNVVLTGPTTTSLGGASWTAFAAKYDSSGQLLWDHASALASGVALTSLGDIVMQNRSALSKFTGALAPLWTTTGFTSGLSNGVALDGAGNIAVTGSDSAGGGPSLLVRKFNANGSFIWERAYEKNSPNLRGSRGADVAFTADGSLIVGGTLLPLSGGSKGLLLKYAP